MFNITQGETFLHDTPPFAFLDDDNNPIPLNTWAVEAWVHFPDASGVTKAITASISADDDKFVVSLRADATETLNWPANVWGEVKFQMKQPNTDIVSISTPMPMLVDAATPVTPVRA